MSKKELILEAKSRTDVGKGASRRLRRLQNEIPAIIYGAGKEPASITMRHDDMLHAVENEAFFSSIIDINVDGQKESVVIKDLQRHPAKPVILHADFLRVLADVALTVNVPLHLLNEDKCIGVKSENGQIIIAMHELQITCLPKDLPEYIELDMLEIHVGDTLHITDLKLPEGVTSVDLSQGDENDHPVVSVSEIREQVIEEPEVEEAVEGEETADGDDAPSEGGDGDDSAGSDEEKSD
ncbi:MAG: 50S ribosomal protein L25/general stress protein Ctc [Gammaproteobacteria bacterium]|nr:50S ribosomal protein L25/general stress protein Ctc [Gammaproteobacteria bacterium]